MVAPALAVNADAGGAVCSIGTDIAVLNCTLSC